MLRATRPSLQTVFESYCQIQLGARESDDLVELVSLGELHCGCFGHVIHQAGLVEVEVVDTS